MPVTLYVPVEMALFSCSTGIRADNGDENNADNKCGELRGAQAEGAQSCDKIVFVLSVMVKLFSIYVFSK